MSAGAEAPLSYKDISARHNKLKDLNLQGTYIGFGERFGHSVGMTYVSALIFGGLYGLGTGIQKGGKTTKLRMNSIINEVTHNGPKMANQAGAMAAFYCVFFKLYNKFVPEYEVATAPVCGALSGALFKCAAGNPRITGAYTVAGCVGFSAVDYVFNLLF